MSFDKDDKNRPAGAPNSLNRPDTVAGHQPPKTGGATGPTGPTGGGVVEERDPRPGFFAGPGSQRKLSPAEEARRDQADKDAEWTRVIILDRNRMEEFFNSIPNNATNQDLRLAIEDARRYGSPRSGLRVTIEIDRSDEPSDDEFDDETPDDETLDTIEDDLE